MDAAVALKAKKYAGKALNTGSCIDPNVCRYMHTWAIGAPGSSARVPQHIVGWLGASVC